MPSPEEWCPSIFFESVQVREHPVRSSGLAAAVGAGASGWKGRSLSRFTVLGGLLLTASLLHARGFSAITHIRVRSKQLVLESLLGWKHIR